MKHKVWEHELETIAKQSLINCHAQGLDSVMFDNTPGDRFRAFVAHPWHNLYNNTFGERITLAMHQHHCEVTLIPIFGETWNVRPFPTMHNNGMLFWPYKYTSQITGGKGRFEEAMDLNPRVLAFDYDVITKPLHMDASEEHTIYVKRGSASAWYVREGAENPDYDSTCWSNNECITEFDFGAHYKPMSVAYLRWLLRIINVEVMK